MADANRGQNSPNGAPVADTGSAAMASPANSSSARQGPSHPQSHIIHFAPSPRWSPSQSLLSVSTASSASDVVGGTKTERLRRSLMDIFHSLYRAFLVSATIMGLTLFMMACIGAVLAFFSAFGSLLLYIGNAVLRKAGHSGYTDDRSAAMVGATGGVLSTLIFGFLSALVSEPTSNSVSPPDTPPVIVQLASSVVIGTLSGTIGSLILTHSGVDLGGLDIAHGARAGAVGGAIMTLAALVFIPIVLGMAVCLLPMMMLVIMTCLQWLQERYEEDWNKYRRLQLPPDDVESATGSSLNSDPH